MPSVPFASPHTPAPTRLSTYAIPSVRLGATTKAHPRRHSHMSFSVQPLPEPVRSRSLVRAFRFASRVSDAIPPTAPAHRVDAADHEHDGCAHTDRVRTCPLCFHCIELSSTHARARSRLDGRKSKDTSASARYTTSVLSPPTCLALAGETVRALYAHEPCWAFGSASHP